MIRKSAGRHLRRALLSIALVSIASPALACVGTIYNNTSTTFTVTFSDHNFRGPLCWVTSAEACPLRSSADRGYVIPAGAAVPYTEDLNDGTWIHIQRDGAVARQDSFWQSRQSETGCTRAWITNGDTSSWGLLFNDPVDGDIAILPN